MAVKVHHVVYWAALTEFSGNAVSDSDTAPPIHC